MSRKYPRDSEIYEEAMKNRMHMKPMKLIITVKAEFQWRIEKIRNINHHDHNITHHIQEDELTLLDQELQIEVNSIYYQSILMNTLIDLHELVSNTRAELYQHWVLSTKQFETEKDIWEKAVQDSRDRCEEDAMRRLNSTTLYRSSYHQRIGNRF
jgi:hypothetical protein|mmetsp:Transcript_9787/g.9547  ORF Transcript_9787/g.9547 Transcript_9787/m.9547 type:complete len:155 (-) Transcript_9787:663-1127(-)